MMPMPTPSTDHNRLKGLAGNWTGEETLHPSPWDPKGGTASGTIASRMDLDGFWLVTDYVQTRAGQVTYRGHGVFGWDPAACSYLMYWFDSMGSVAMTPAKGRLDGQRLVFAQEGPMGHSRYTYDFQADGRYCFSMEHSEDGKAWTIFMDGTYRRT
jgi:uncharacterized protein DUF1579